MVCLAAWWILNVDSEDYLARVMKRSSYTFHNSMCILEEVVRSPYSMIAYRINVYYFKGCVNIIKFSSICVNYIDGFISWQPSLILKL